MVVDLNRGHSVLYGQRHNIFTVNLPGRHPAFYAQGYGRSHRLAHGHTGTPGPNGFHPGNPPFFRMSSIAFYIINLRGVKFISMDLLTGILQLYLGGMVKFGEAKTWQFGYVPGIIYFLVLRDFWPFKRSIAWG